MLIDEIRKLTDGELEKSLDDSRRSLMNLRFRKATMQLTNVMEIKEAKKDIAKMLTVIKQRQILGLNNGTN